MDGYCDECSMARCDTYPDECPVKYPPRGDPHWLEAHAELVAVHEEKSSGYGTGDDPLANFASVAALSGDMPYIYPCRRAIEKLSRVESLVRQGRYDDLQEEFMDVASLMLCAEALRRRG